MATKLVNLSLDRIDLVKDPANAGARVRLMKGKDGARPQAKRAATFDEVLLGAQLHDVEAEFRELVSALSDTICGVLWDPETTDKAGAIRTALGSFETALEGEIADWLSAATPAALVKSQARDAVRLRVASAVEKALRARTKGRPETSPEPIQDVRAGALRTVVEHFKSQGATARAAVEKTIAAAPALYRDYVDDVVAGAGEAQATESAQDEVLRKARELVTKSADKKFTEAAAVREVLKNDQALYERYRAEAVAVGGAR